MKVLFVWPGLTGYMGDCWRELARRDEIELKVVVDLNEKTHGQGFEASDVMSGLDWRSHLEDLWGWRPDVVFTVGWRNKLCRAAALTDWSVARKVICFDMPWEWKPRKVLARFVLWRYLRRFDAAFVNGYVAKRYARWLGFGEADIFTGLIGTNTRRFGSHIGGDGFLYVGREAKEKGLAVLRKAYDCYRASGGRWALRIVNGVRPSELGRIYAQSDCFVLASTWEPWGVVLVEAAAAGLPIICTDKCGARHEVVKGNGLVVKAGDVEALADAMMSVERGSADINPELGGELAKPYSCEAWAERVIGICQRLENSKE